MNLNSIIALLEIKGIITREEGEKLVEYLANKPQSTMLNDAVEQVKELVSAQAPAIKKLPALEKKLANVKDEAVKAAEDVASKVASEIAQVDEAMGDKKSTDTDQTK